MRAMLAGFLLLVGAGTSPANAAQGEATSTSPGNLAAAGRYTDRAGPDVVIELELRRDGRFSFGIAAGSLGAQAQGRWTSDGRVVVLNTEPRPTPPEFRAGPVTRSGAHPLSILVNGPNGEGIATIDVRVGMADGRVLEGYTQYYGWQPGDGEQVGTPLWVELSEEIQGIPLRRFALDANAGNVFTFTLIPNDFGVADFRDTELQITPDGGLSLPFRGDVYPMARDP